MKTIIVIENERMVFLDIKIAFTRLGYNVIHASSNNIQQITASGMIPDLILMDVLSAKQINGLLKFPFGNYTMFKNIPVILTNTGFNANIRFCVKHKINVIGEFEKPYDTSDLVKHYQVFLLHQPLLKTAEFRGALNFA